VSSPTTVRRVMARDFATKRAAGERIVMVTAYDALFARLVDEAGVDAILVGDSLGNVVAGLDSTLGVTLDQMIYHGTIVCRGAKRAMVVVDMPFMTYQLGAARAAENCGRVVQETGAQGVKLEGASPPVLEAVRAVTELGVPVMAHLGLTPQHVLAIGGYRVQAKGELGLQKLVDDARRLEDAGAFSLVLELVPAAAAAAVRAAVTIPTIGIGAGVDCDGQVLVLPDLLGLNDAFAPKFLKRYASLGGEVRDAVRRFGDEVRSGEFPAAEHSF
jgi:3-methyl-2-oxobutanoate hydroxymethyltransferase